MAGSTFGTLFRVTTWGESHGTGVGVVIDGCPAGLTLHAQDIQNYLNRRKPGQTKYATPRKENDAVEIQSGIFEDKTTGAPISMVVYNQTQRSKDYSDIATTCRPGHADYSFDIKYGIRDYRGGGRSSGRETIARVAAGAVAALLLKQLGIEVLAFSQEIGGIHVEPEKYAISQVTRADMMKSPLYMPDLKASQQAEELLSAKMAEKNSVGGVIACAIHGIPAGIGEPVFDKLDARLAQAVMSIGAVKGIEIGDGFDAARHTGLENNDCFFLDNGRPAKKTNHAGGILGGISDGDVITLRAAVKPTPSIAQNQHTICRQESVNDKQTDNIPYQTKHISANAPLWQERELEIHGRHDPIIVPRAVVVVESMAALTVCDLLMESMTSRLDAMKFFFAHR